MSALSPDILESLGPVGLHRVLDDLLDKARLVRLAGAVGLSYGGMRIQRQTRATLLDDLVARCVADDDGARRAVLRTLQREMKPLLRPWRGLAAEEKAKRLADPSFLLSRGNLGKHLLLVSAAEGDGEKAGFEVLLARRNLLELARSHSNGNGSGAPPPPTREEQRLRKQGARLEKKVKHLEGQLAKSREGERAAKRDLIERRGELAEARMAGERLRRELEAARAEATRNPPATRDGDGSGQVARALRRLTAEQKKLAAAIAERPARRTVTARLDASALEPLQERLDGLAKEIGAVRREIGKRDRSLVRQLEALDGQLARTLEAARKARKKKVRPRDGKARVGVFIDVQNVYYGARQLKGKLDFDALLAAAAEDRRLIEATAYVVESKEIDQSGFIKLLEKRAIDVRRKTLQVRADGSTKGDWDMELALDILAAAPRLDVVVLVSGDGDFTSLVKRVKEIGPRVEVIGFPRTTAKALLEAADDYRPLDRKFMIYQRKTRSKKSAAKPEDA